MGEAEDIARTLHAAAMPLRAIAERLALLGHKTSAGTPYGPSAVARMVAAPSCPKPMTPRAPSPVAPAPAREPLPALPPDAPIEDRLRRRLAELDELAAEARGEGSYTPAVAAKKSAIALELQIEATRRAPDVVDPSEGMTDEEIRSALVEAVAGWDESTIEAVQDAINARIGIRGSGLQVLAGGWSREGT
jgi:hypothetical protein